MDPVLNSPEHALNVYNITATEQTSVDKVVFEKHVEFHYGGDQDKNLPVSLWLSCQRSMVLHALQWLIMNTILPTMHVHIDEGGSSDSFNK